MIYFNKFLLTKSFCVPVLWATLLSVMVIPSATSQSYLQEIQEKWSNSSDYLIDIAKTMPDSLYGYKPTEEQMTFQAQLIHISNNMINLASNQLGYNKEPKPENPGKTSNAGEVRHYLESAFRYAGNAIAHESELSLNRETAFFAGPKTHRQIIHLMNDHVTHHRGQLIIYLRLKGLTPRGYVGW